MRAAGPRQDRIRARSCRGMPAVGKAEVLACFNEHCDEQITLLAFGSRVTATLEAAQKLALLHEVAICVVNMRFIKPLDQQLLNELAVKTHLFVTIEEHAVMAGAGSAVNEYLAQAHWVKPILNLGLADTFMHQASHAQMLQHAGLDAQGIEKSVQHAWLKLGQTSLS